MLYGTKLEFTKKYNSRIIIEVIMKYGPISRVEIAKMTGLTTATITNLASELIEHKIVMETGRRKGQRGQPAIELELNPNGRFSIGFELGRNQLVGVLINLNGEIQEEIHESWNYPTPEIALPKIAEYMQLLLKKTTIPGERMLGLGLAMPGPFLTKEKKILSPSNFPGWAAFPTVSKLTKLLNCNVFIENDAMAAVIGEKYFGEGKYYNDFYYIHFGIGLGAAMVIDGNPYQGFSPNTGELGWIRYPLKGRRAIIGKYLSLKALYDLLKNNGLQVTNKNDLEILFKEQNMYLWDWLNEAVECLEIVAGSISAILGPEVIFFGGHLPLNILEYIIERLSIEQKATRASLPNKKIFHEVKYLHSTVGDLSSALGAAALPINECFSTTAI